MGQADAHLLKQTTENLQQNGGTQFIEIVFHRFSHLLLRQYYNTTLRRSKSAVNQTIKRFHESHKQGSFRTTGTACYIHP